MIQKILKNLAKYFFAKQHLTNYSNVKPNKKLAIIINIDKKIIVKIAYIIETTSKSGGSYYQTLNLYEDITKNFKQNSRLIIFTNKKKFK